ncbi:MULTISPECIES: CynX/NimT family MFS transporter [Bacillus]|uniref:MFS transporter n=1 Tax=Bacillus TaxID=1386 RepID=UPI0003099B17|nr:MULTISPECIES: MFS transporter [Bacillus]MCA0118438.1 MFS transporter [Bacillus sp. RSS_NA_20]MCA0165791.1 MFS transporter [Bacillus sp. RAR_M1_44]MCM3229557.1 MFS transporter [Bacillus altitudinis]MCY7498293.1 MFS transporter [Bacillus altitudinis]MCY7535510.1 MFS transporter [Bacillus altitudinis]
MIKKVFYLAALFLAALNLRPIITSVASMMSMIQSDLGVSALTASLLTTLPVLCMGVFAPVATKLSRRFGLERTLFFSIFLITIATGLRGTSQTVTILLMTAFAGGVGISFAGPLLSSFIKKYFPKSPGIVSVYSISMTVGAALASGLTIPIYLRSEHNLPLALACWAVLGVIALILWLGLARKNQQADHADVPLRLPLRNKKAIQFTLFFGFMSSMFYSLTAWISPIALDFGNSPQYAAMLLTIFTLIQIPVALLVPAIVNRLGKPKLFLILCSLSELIGLIFLLLPMPILPAVIFLGIGAGGLFPLALMLPIIETRTPEEAGTWSAMSQMGGYIMGGFGPFLIGLIFDISGHFQAAIVAMLAIVMLMIGVQLSMKLGKKRDEVSN